MDYIKDLYNQIIQCGDPCIPIYHVLICLALVIGYYIGKDEKKKHMSVK